MRYSHSGSAKKTTLAGDMTAVALSFTVADGTGYPDGSVGPFFVTIGKGTASYEKILCSARASNTFTVWVSGGSNGRGADGTVAQTHATSDEVEHTWTATEADQASAHLETGSGAHGYPAISSIVTLTGAQTLEDKTISGADNTLSNIPQAAVTGLVAALDARIEETLVDAKGDLLVGSAADTVARLGVGANGRVLTADSSEATGMKWAVPATSGPVILATVPATGVASINFGAAMVGYSLYRVMFRVKSGTTLCFIRGRLRVAGSDASGAHYHDSTGGVGTTFWVIGSAGTLYSVGEILIANPSDAAPTVIDSRWSAANVDNSVAATQVGGHHTQNTAYDDLTLYSAGGELLTGEFVLLGYA